MNQQQPPYGAPAPAQAPYQAPAPAPYQTPHGPPQSQEGNGIAIAAMVLGIISLVLFWIPFLGLICGVLGAIFGFVGLGKSNRIGGKGKGMAIAGLVCGIIGTLIGVWYVIAVFAAANEINEFNQGFNEGFNN